MTDATRHRATKRFRADVFITPPMYVVNVCELYFVDKWAVRFIDGRLVERALPGQSQRFGGKDALGGKWVYRKDKNTRLRTGNLHPQFFRHTFLDLRWQTIMHVTRTDLGRIHQCYRCRSSHRHY